MTDPITDPAAAFVGALLHAPAAAALDLLDLVGADDLADVNLSLIAETAHRLAEDGVPPDPTTVLASVRATGTADGPERLRALSLLLADLYAGCPTPASARWYAAAVLDETLRRRCQELADRVHQAAESAALDTLVNVLDVECRAVRAVLNRRTAVQEVSPPHLRAVGS